MSRRCSVALGAFGVAVYLLSAAAPGSATVAASVGISAGTLTATIPGSVGFTGVTLNGQDQATTGTLAIDVKDASGSGSGWKLQATSTTFKDAGTHTLATSATTIATSSVTDSCDTGATCSTGDTNVSYPYTLPAATTAPTATTFYNAQANSGMGNQTVTPTFTVALPATTYAPAGGSYTSTWTITYAAGP
ncbi:MAG TPA: WxL domain-containing protein [Acidimicrobiales bacterium]|nr:WxL domain-containing protein [Acidimicrobiales bacterium]